MAFDEIALPLRVGFGSTGGPAFSTEVVMIDSGYERRNQNWSQARRVFDARSGLRSAADVSVLQGFFLARAGRARGFRLRDWSDYSSAADGISAPACTDQPLGTGDGATVIFQLAKSYGSGGVTYSRPIAKPVAGSVTIGINAIAQISGVSIDSTTGLVSFASPPVAGAVLTAGFQFDVPVRFDTDQLSLTAETYATQKADIPLVELRL